MQLLENADNPETDLNISDSKTKAMALQIRQEAKKATTINAASILLAKYGYKENYPPLYCLNTLTTPRSKLSFACARSGFDTTILYHMYLFLE